MKLYIDCQYESVLACPLSIVALWVNKEFTYKDFVEWTADKGKIKKVELIEGIDKEVESGAIVYEDNYIYPSTINSKGLLKVLKAKIEFLAAKYSYKNKNLQIVLCRDGLPESAYYKTTLETNTLEAQITKAVSTSRREWLIKTVYGSYYREYNWSSNFGLATEDHCLRIIENGINHLFIIENLSIVGQSWNKAYKKLKPNTIVTNIYPGQPPSWWFEFLSDIPFGTVNQQVTGCKDPNFIKWVCKLSKPLYTVNYLFEDFK